VPTLTAFFAKPSPTHEAPKAGAAAEPSIRLRARTQDSGTMGWAELHARAAAELSALPSAADLVALTTAASSRGSSAVSALIYAERAAASDSSSSSAGGGIGPVTVLEAQGGTWQEAAAQLSSELSARGVRRGQLVSISAQPAPPSRAAGAPAGFSFFALHSDALPDRGPLSLRVQAVVGEAGGRLNELLVSALQGMPLSAPSDVISVCAATLESGSVLFAWAYQ
jgi:hypothetical protein